MAKLPASAEGDFVVVTFASVEPGFYAVNGCVAANVALSHDGTYVADPAAVPDTVAVLRLEGDADHLSGTLQGIFSNPAAGGAAVVFRHAHGAVLAAGHHSPRAHLRLWRHQRVRPTVPGPHLRHRPVYLHHLPRRGRYLCNALSKPRKAGFSAGD